MAKQRRTTKKKNTSNITKTAKRQSKAVCKKQTLKKYLTRPSPPYRAALCVGQKKRGNDGLMYISRPDINYGPARWVKV
jgi:hypothetical protein